MRILIETTNRINTCQPETKAQQGFAAEITSVRPNCGKPLLPAGQKKALQEDDVIPG